MPAYLFARRHRARKVSYKMPSSTREEIIVSFSCATEAQAEAVEAAIEALKDTLDGAMLAAYGCTELDVSLIFGLAVLTGDIPRDDPLDPSATHAAAVWELARQAVRCYEAIAG